MEIKYTRTFTSKDGKFTAGEINVMLGCAIEIYEMRPELAEGKLGVGEICVLLFGITPEEYALRDSDAKAFDALAAQLRKNVPADRFIGLRVTDLKGAPVQRPVKPKTGESIDGGAFISAARAKTAAASAGPIDGALLECAKLQKLAREKDAPEGVKQDAARARQRLGQAMMTLEKLIVADDALTANRFPWCGFDGRIELYTTQERASRVRAQICAASENTEVWTLREIPHAEFTAFFKRCAELGLPAFRVDNGFAAAELNLDDFLPAPAPENAILRGHILREIEYGLRWKNLKDKNAAELKVRGALESMLTFRNFAWREAGNAVVYAACIEGYSDGVALCTKAARAKLDPEKKCRIVDAGKFMIVTDNTGKRWMAVFTSRILAAAFAEKRDANAEPVAMTFDDLKARMNVCDGILIDMETFGYRIPKEHTDAILDMRGKPPMIVRIQPPKPEKPAAAEADQPDVPMPLPNPDAGALPDPDAAAKPLADAPADAGKPEEAEPEEENAPAEPAPETESTAEGSGAAAEKPTKKSFFKKLFGKDN